MRLILCFLALLPTLAYAQPAGPRTVRILYLGAPPDAPKTLHLFDGTECQEVELPKMNLSPIYKLPGGPLVIRMLPAPPADPLKVDARAPKATIAESVSDLYLMISSDPANPVTPIKMQVVDADATKFRKGQMLWFNLTQNAVGGQLGKQKIALASNSKTVVDAPASGSEEYPVNLSFRIPGDKRLFPLCETKWSHDPRSRSIFFIVPQQGSRAPRIMGIPDYRLEESPSSKTEAP